MPINADQPTCHVAGCRLAADIGGTFTDIAMLSPRGELYTAKVLSTPDDYARAILDGFGKLLSGSSIGAADVGELLHASTVATNAILEARGARTALVTTAGFRDVLELRRIRVPRLYEPLYEKPAPLAERRHRFEVRERIGADGAVVVPLNEEDVRQIAEQIAAQEMEAVAVCFLNSYVNPDHERRAGELLRRHLPGVFLTLSVDVLPEIREYERTSTTVINAYVGPPVARYIGSLRERLRNAGFTAPLRMMQSSGGVLDIEAVIARPAAVVESGPAAGVIGAARIGALCGYRDIITLDMGGTTAKAAVIENGRHMSTDEYEVGGGISLSSRLVKGGGYALKLPVIDISEVGAGGGSIVWTDPAGLLKVGPHSAGAAPGPACYGLGGTEPTVTDANVVLGYLSPTGLAGGSVPIDAMAAHDALSRVAAGRDLREVASGVVQLTTATMMRAVKAVTTYRGRDPRDFVLFAFGGGGGLYAAELARSLGMRTVVIPPAAGVFSALGLLVADIEVGRSRGLVRRLGEVDAGMVDTLLEAMQAESLAELRLDRGEVDITRSADIRYAGQAFELGIALPDGTLSPAAIAALGPRFDDEHEATYGHRLAAGHPKEIVALRLVARVCRRAPGLPRRAEIETAAATCPTTRQVYFAETGEVETVVIGRADLGRSPRAGPLIVEELEGTSVIPPGVTARLDDAGNIVMELDGGVACATT